MLIVQLKRALQARIAAATAAAANSVVARARIAALEEEVQVCVCLRACCFAGANASAFARVCMRLLHTCFFRHALRQLRIWQLIIFTHFHRLMGLIEPQEFEQFFIGSSVRCGRLVRVHSSQPRTLSSAIDQDVSRGVNSFCRLS